MQKSKVPEKWFIWTDKTTEPIVREYINKTYCVHINDNNEGIGWGFTNICDIGSYHRHPSSHFPSDYTEITFDFFKTHILNKILFNENDWNIEVASTDQFKEVLDYFISLGHEMYKLSCHYNTTNSPYLRYSNGYTSYNNYRTVEYRTEKSITWEQFQSLKNKKITSKEIIGYKLIKKIEGYKTEVGRISSDKTLFCLYKDNPNFEPVYDEQYKAGDWVVCFKKPFESASITLNKAFKVEKYLGDKVQVDGFAINGDVDYSYCFRVATQAEIEAASTKTISMNGQFDLVIIDNKVFHNLEDITTFVLGVRTLWETCLSHGKLKSGTPMYDLVINDISFSKTGCESKPTNLSDWKKVWKELK